MINPSFQIRLIVFSLLIVNPGCDFISPQKEFKLVIPQKDYSYNRSSKHLKEFLKKGGFEIEIVYANNAIEANRMVANQEADMTLAMDHSTFIPEAIGYKAGKLRTIAPLYQRLFFLFSRIDLDTIDREAQFSNRTIGVEVLNGETHRNLTHLFASSRLDNILIIDKHENPDFIHFWGTYYGERATKLLDEGWNEVSIDPDWIEYITMNEPTLDPFVLPAIPGVEGSVNLNTISSRTLLVCGAHLEENATYRLSEYIFQHQLELVSYDKMYRFISDHFDKKDILFPVHSGTDKFLRRNQPSFFQQYAELTALIFSIIAIIYGAIQGLRNRLLKLKKERIDVYFISYLEIRSAEKLSNQEKIIKLSALMQKALVQLTNEKLDKNDFHIFSRLVQQDLLILREK